MNVAFPGFLRDPPPVHASVNMCYEECGVNISAAEAVYREFLISIAKNISRIELGGRE